MHKARAFFYVCAGLPCLALAAPLPARAGAQSPTYITQWGTPGSGVGQFSGLFGIAVDASGDVYAADGFNDRIQKFTSSGTYLGQWGTTGSGNGQFNYPTGCAPSASTRLPRSATV